MGRDTELLQPLADLPEVLQGHHLVRALVQVRGLEQSMQHHLGSSQAQARDDVQYAHGSTLRWPAFHHTEGSSSLLSGTGAAPPSSRTNVRTTRQTGPMPHRLPRNAARTWRSSLRVPSASR